MAGVEPDRTPSDPRPAPEADSAVRARGLVEKAVADDQLSGTAALLQRLCRAAADGLSLPGGALHLVNNDGAPGLAASSDAVTARVADLTFTTGDGPSTEAIRLRRPVLVADVADGPRRWPGFTQVARENGVRAFFCFPIQLGGLVLGVLQLHDVEPHPLSAGDVELAVSFTRLAADTLLGERAAGADRTWDTLLDHRAEIHQAQGMVMVDLGIDLAEALLRMRAHAFSQGLAMIDLARAIIAGTVLPAAGEAEHE